MFLPNSRYSKIPTVETTTSDGRPVVALKLRSLPPVTGESYTVKDNDQLDHLALLRYADATQFWHLADANTELEARHLLRTTGDTFHLPPN